MTPPTDDRETPPPLLDELPPVKPPSAVFILQLFVVPGLIVAAIVGVWLLFGRIASSEQNWQNLVGELRHPNEHRRWRAAHGLAQMLKADQDLGAHGQQLSQNVEIARSLADTLGGELSKESKVEEDLLFQAFLARTLGVLDCPDIVLPPLERASQVAHERETGELRTLMLDVRKNALVAIAVLAGRMGEQKRPLRSAGLMPALLTSAQSEDKLVRQVTAYALGLIDDPQAIGQLHAMLGDADPLTQIDATIGLARHGDAGGFDVLKDVLSSAETPVERGSAEEYERFLSLKNSLKAIEQLAAKLTDGERREAVALVKPIADGYREPDIRVSAVQALLTLQKNAVP